MSAALAPGRHRHPLGADPQIAVARCDGLAQRRQAEGLGVAGVPGFKSGDAGVDDRRRRREIRFANLEMHDVATLPLQLIGAFEHLHHAKRGGCDRLGRLVEHAAFRAIATIPLWSLTNHFGSLRALRTPAPAKARAYGLEDMSAKRTDVAASQPPNGDQAVGADSPFGGFVPYVPKEGEEYMNPAQVEHFRNMLNAWRRELMEQVDRTVNHLQDEASNFPDPLDRATQEEELGIELRTPRSRAPFDPQDPRDPRAHRAGRLWLLRHLRRGNRLASPRGAAHCHAMRGLQGAGRAARTATARLSATAPWRRATSDVSRPRHRGRCT